MASEKWQCLSESDQSYVKSFNGKLRKELRNKNTRNDNNRTDRESISSRRAIIEVEDLTDSENPPMKKRRTVEFQDGIEEISKSQTNYEESGDKMINNKRSVLWFNVRNRK